mgnify:CR=1 FL=1
MGEKIGEDLNKGQFLYVEKDYCNDVSMMNAIRLRHSCLKSHHTQNLINICKRFTFVLNTHLSAHNLLDS